MTQRGSSASAAQLSPASLRVVPCTRLLWSSLWVTLVSGWPCPAAQLLMKASAWIVIQPRGTDSFPPVVPRMQNLVHPFPTRKTQGFWREGGFLFLQKILQCTWVLCAGFDLCKGAPRPRGSFKLMKASTLKGAESFNLTGRASSAHAC